MLFLLERRVLRNCCFLVVMLAASGCSKQPQDKHTAVSSDQNNTNAQNTGVLASASNSGIISASTLLSTVDNLIYIDQEGQSHMPKYEAVFSEQGRGVAYIAQKGGDSFVVHNGKPGKPYKEISHLVVSPDGRRVAYSFASNNKLRMVIDGVEGPIFDDVWDVVFSPDSRHVAYYTKSNDKMRIVLDGKMSEESNSFNSTQLFTTDSGRLAYCIYSDGSQKGRFIISDLQFNKINVKECLDTPFIANRDKTRIALAIEDEGRKRMIDFSFAQPDVITKGPLYDNVDKYDFGSDGTSLAYMADKSGKRYLVLNGKEELMPENMVITSPPQIRPDLKGVGVLLSTNLRSNNNFSLHQAMYKDGSKKKVYANANSLTYNQVTNATAFVAQEGARYFVVVNGKEGPDYDMIVTPMFSLDGKKLVYRARKDGKRFVVVADGTGKVIRQHPQYEMVFSTVFTEDGKSVAYGVKNGQELWWKVEEL